MSETKSKMPRWKSAMLKPLLFLSILSMSLTACASSGTRVEFLTPQFRSDELACMDAPAGQLAAGSSLALALDRVTGIDEAGEDCRQRLGRVKTKIEIFNEVVATINAGKQPKKD